MYIKRIPGPVAVTLKDGRRMTRADLPAHDTRRWVASRKAAVVDAVDAGLITGEEAMKTWGLSEEELDGWRRTMARHGETALRVTHARRFRAD